MAFTGTVTNRPATRRSPLRAASAVALSFVALAPHHAAPRDAAPIQQAAGAARQVVFTHYAPLFSNAQILRRLLSPLAQEEVQDELGRKREALSAYPLDLAQERFVVYVPSPAPPSGRGFALLVFISPWDQPYLPFGWAAQLNRYGVIFVSPARAGNEAAVLSRRVPLALSAEENIAREFPIDRQRIYIGGFSGGSRVALRIALGYPDVFRGVLLDAGAAPLGGAYPLPPRDLFLHFQSSTHLVYITGELDTGNLDGDAVSLRSMRQWCVLDVEAHEAPGVAHEMMSPTAFGRGLGRLLSAVSPDPARLEVCRSRVEARLEGSLAQAQSLISGGRRIAARKLLLEIDARYGGLAAPRILELARSCRCNLPR